MSTLAEIMDPPVTCSKRCGWEWPATPDAESRRATHEHLRHGEPLPVQELSGTTWQERAANAVQQVANRGANFFVFDALREFGVGDPPNAKTAMGRFSALIHDLGYAHPVGYEKSPRAGTKKSAAAVWNRDGRRCVDLKCKQRAGVA